MKKKYSSPTIFNASNMKLSITSHARNPIVLETPSKDGLLPSFVLSGARALIVGRKDVGEKAFGLPK